MPNLENETWLDRFQIGNVQHSRMNALDGISNECLIVHRKLKFTIQKCIIIIQPLSNRSVVYCDVHFSFTLFHRLFGLYVDYFVWCSSSRFCVLVSQFGGNRAAFRNNCLSSYITSFGNDVQKWMCFGANELCDLWCIGVKFVCTDCRSLHRFRNLELCEWIIFLNILFVWNLLLKSQVDFHWEFELFDMKRLI